MHSIYTVRFVIYCSCFISYRTFRYSNNFRIQALRAFKISSFSICNLKVRMILFHFEGASFFFKKNLRFKKWEKKTCWEAPYPPHQSAKKNPSKTSRNLLTFHGSSTNHTPPPPTLHPPRKGILAGPYDARAYENKPPLGFPPLKGQPMIQPPPWEARYLQPSKIWWNCRVSVRKWPTWSYLWPLVKEMLEWW